jgi:hypothetical protein
MMIEGSRSGAGSGSIPLTNGSGSRRRIRIRNTDLNQTIFQPNVAQRTVARCGGDVEGSGSESGSIPLTSGSGSGRPKTYGSGGSGSGTRDNLNGNISNPNVAQRTVARRGSDVDASLQGGRGRHAEPTLRHRRIQRSGAAQHGRGKQPDVGYF